MTSKEEIARAASDNGWRADTGIDEILYTRGKEELFVGFGVRGQVIFASTKFRELRGQGPQRADHQDHGGKLNGIVVGSHCTCWGYMHRGCCRCGDKIETGWVGIRRQDLWALFLAGASVVFYVVNSQPLFLLGLLLAVAYSQMPWHIGRLSRKRRAIASPPAAGGGDDVDQDG